MICVDRPPATLRSLVHIELDANSYLHGYRSLQLTNPITKSDIENVRRSRRSEIIVAVYLLKLTTSTNKCLLVAIVVAGGSVIAGGGAIVIERWKMCECLVC
jgi:hypothetical protein